jgi:predicted dehydrogenase
VPLLVGHHRRHNPLVAEARQRIATGMLGRIVAVHAMFWLMKPDDYFDVSWRREPGAGPVLLNAIHDIDLLRHLIGEIDWVSARQSNAVRAYPVEETAAILLRFGNGALGTIAVSDTVVAPWSWEMTAAENPAYPATGQSCYWIAGTHGSLELPSLRLWRNPGRRGWWEPISATASPVAHGDPLVRQIEQFARVIRNGESPLAPASEGLKTLEVVEAIGRSAAAQMPVSVSSAAEAIGA